MVSTSPINEYMTEELDRMKGIMEPRRKAEHTQMYAQAVREVAADYRIALLDLWKVFMDHAGWKEGESPLPGSKALPPNPFLRMLMHDGRFSWSSFQKVNPVADTDFDLGLHFNSVAYTLFHQELMRLIANTWPDQTPEKLRWVLPVWNEPSQWDNWEKTEKAA